jgi:hypothetical protein
MRESRTNGRDGGDDFTKLQLVQNGGFTGGIETDHENSHLLLPPQLVENLRKGETHDCDWRRRGLTNVEYVKEKKSVLFDATRKQTRSSR